MGGRDESSPDGQTGMSTSSSGEEANVFANWQTSLQNTFCPQDYILREIN